MVLLQRKGISSVYGVKLGHHTKSGRGALICWCPWIKRNHVFLQIQVQAKTDWAAVLGIRHKLIWQNWDLWPYYEQPILYGRLPIYKS